MTVKCEVKCGNCSVYVFEREVENRAKGKKLARDLLNGRVKCTNNCGKKVEVVDREALKEEWGINDE